MRRKLAAILSADVQGYSRLMGEDEEATVRTLTGHRELMAGLIAEHRGRVVDAPGDNLLAEFASAVDALAAAVAVQQGLAGRNAALAAHRRMEFRIGINLGEVIAEEQRLYGDGVNIAAGVQDLAEPGGICISGATYDQVENKLPLGYEFLGEHAVKNIARPVRVYRVPVQGADAAPGPDEAPGPPARSLEPPVAPSLAVLPFENMSRDPDQEYFSDGITEDIITDLSAHRWWPVPASRWPRPGAPSPWPRATPTATRRSGTSDILSWWRPEDAVAPVEKAMRLNPHYPAEYLWILGHACYQARRYEEAIRALDRVTARNPDWLPAHAFLAATYAELGRPEDARRAGRDVLRLSPQMTVERATQRLPYKDPAMLARAITAFITAGLAGS